MSDSVLFKVKVRDYIPLTAGHGDEVVRKEKLLEKIRRRAEQDRNDGCDFARSVSPSEVLALLSVAEMAAEVWGCCCEYCVGTSAPPLYCKGHAAWPKFRSLLGEEVPEPLGFDPEEVRVITLESPILMMFRQALFARVVPNVKRLGLLTPYVRKAFEEMGVIQFEDYDPEAHDRAMGLV